MIFESLFWVSKIGSKKKIRLRQNELKVVGHLIQANQLVSYRLKATSYRLQATRLQATGYKSLRLQATGYKRRGLRYKGLAF